MMEFPDLPNCETTSVTDKGKEWGMLRKCAQKEKMSFVWKMFHGMEKMNSLLEAFKTSVREWAEGKDTGANFKDTV